MGMNEPQQTRTPRRRPGNVRVIDAHYSDYRRRVKRSSGWKIVDDVEVPKRKRWLVKYVDLTGTERSGGTYDNKADATARADELTTELRDGSHIDRRKGQATVQTVADAWLKAITVDKAAGTVANYTSIARNHVLPRWGALELAAIGHADVQSWVAELADTLAPATVHRAFVVFSSILDYAIADGRLRANPATKVRLPKVEGIRETFLSDAEVQRLAAAADYLHALRSNRTRTGRDRDAELNLDRDADGLPVIPVAPASAAGLMVRFAGYSGLRVGELSALRVRDLELTDDAALIHVRRANVEVGGSLQLDERPKGGKVRDVAPLFDTVMIAELRAHIAGRSADDYVFTTATGAPLRRSNLNKRVIVPAAELAGLEDVTVHTLRHAYASLCASAGVPSRTVARWMGHASPVITERVYVGLFPEDLTAQATAATAALAARRAAAPKAPALRVVGE